MNARDAGRNIRTWRNKAIAARSLANDHRNQAIYYEREAAEFDRRAEAAEAALYAATEDGS